MNGFIGDIVDELCKDCKRNPIDKSRSKRCCSVCLDKRIKSQQEYWNSHRDERLKYQRNYYNGNKEEISKKTKEIYKRDKEKILKYAKEYRDNNKDKVRKAKQKCWYAKHEYYLGKAKEWRANNLEQSNRIIRKSTLKRKAQKIGNGGEFTLDEWDDLKSKYNNQCICCGKSNVTLEVDHVIPLSMEGTNTIDNIQPLCRSCNAKKHRKMIDYRIQYSLVQEWT